MVRIGTKFEWNGHIWTVYSFNKTQVLIRDGAIKTAIDFDVFLRIINQAA